LNIEKVVKKLIKDTIGKDRFIMSKIESGNKLYVEIFEKAITENNSLTELEKGYAVFVLLKTKNIEKITKPHLKTLFESIRINKAGDIIFKENDKTYVTELSFSEVTENIPENLLSKEEKLEIVHKIMPSITIYNYTEISNSGWVDDYPLNVGKNEFIKLFSQSSTRYEKLFKKESKLKDNLEKVSKVMIERLITMLQVEEINNIEKIYPDLITLDYKIRYLKANFEKCLDKIDKPEQTRIKELKIIKNKVLCMLNESWELALEELDSEKYSLKVFFEGKDWVIRGQNEIKNVSIKNIFKLRDFGILMDFDISYVTLKNYGKTKSDLLNLVSFEDIVKASETRPIRYTNELLSHFLKEEVKLNLLAEFPENVKINYSGFFFDGKISGLLLKNLAQYSDEELNVEESFMDYLLLELKH
tara:strand:- start:12520 stop:13770 length:1251 start_codon:yes stop_codon:yes gene_type:complete